MKATGIFRRIDELGRIVIPKEIRKNLHIREGDNIEIFITDKEEIILKKYSSLKNIKDFAQRFTDSIYSLLKSNIIVTDKDHIIALSGELKKEYLEKEISEELLSFISRRNNILETHKKNLQILENNCIECTYVIEPICVEGDAIGLFIIFDTKNVVSETEKKIARIATEFFMKYLEE
jgi:AbrB family transcriptional regulator (stage V sporulation protein T)